MANYNALLNCVNSAVPGGPTNSVQYNSGSGNLAGVGPLTNGQVMIGSTGGAPQAQTLSAGSGITITNGPGSIIISNAGSASGAGLYSQVMSTTPTSAGTGLTTWLNQGSGVVTDSAVGMCIDVPSSGSTANFSGRYMAAPMPPYKITTLVAVTRNSSSFSGVGIGWYDGIGKLHTLNYTTNGGGAPIFQVLRWTNVTTVSAVDVASSANAFPQPVWLQIADDGTNVSFSFSQDGANFLPIFSVAKASGFLGSSGYSNIIFGINPQGSRTLGTVMSWRQN
ncbi:hypothetical protein [Mesorhizobium waimense]|uniref:hypothetical protein n=1 Tax=Mesorhizobium waimense TaxID=1300307 RepID=UPI0011C42D8C|nr:hypothetical protein [Mesorhizobium waimense]